MCNINDVSEETPELSRLDSPFKIAPRYILRKIQSKKKHGGELFRRKYQSIG